MLQLLKTTPATLCDRISRRDWLRVGILGLNLPNLLRAEDAQRCPRTRLSSAQGKTGGRVKACIMLYLAGRPSQPDIWEMKPAMPVDFRGQFKAMATTVHGKSRRTGDDPSDDPVTPQDVVATIYSLLGIPPETELPDNLCRPVRLGGPGQRIQGVMA
jgi:Protein of unknown function (DUF1501)